MSYELTYTVHYTNEENQEVLFNIYRKDVVPDAVTNYYCTGFEITKNGDDSKFATIQPQELSIGICLEEGSELDWDTFFSGVYDEWKIICTIEGKSFFHGFILPDEGRAPLQDKPYDIQVRAVDGLQLLKKKVLAKLDGTSFKGWFPIIDFIAAALAPTGLELPIQTRINTFHSGIDDKNDDPLADFFAQAELNHRSFMNDATTFTNCFDVLEKILKGWASLQYWDGKWLIKSISEIQYNPGGEYFTNYDHEGTVIDSDVDTDNQAQVGRNIDNYPILADADQSAQFPVKSVKTSYRYDIWPEIPLNNKFERGTEISTGTALDEDDIDGDGDTSEVIGTYRRISIDDWEWGRIVPIAANKPFVLNPSTDNRYVEKVFNEEGVEIKRKIVIETNTSGVDGEANWLRSEGIPVRQGDKIRFDVSKKYSNDFSSSVLSFATLAHIYILSNDESVLYGLHSGDQNTDVMPGTWINDSVGELFIIFSNGQDSRKWASGSAVTSQPIPIDGTLYIVLPAFGPTSEYGTLQSYCDFSFEYLPIIGGISNVKGEYHFRSQDGSYLDTDDNEIFINNSARLVTKGALRINGSAPSNSFYRLGINEARSFKDLVNLGQFNHLYRRFKRIEGTFNYLNFAAENNPLDRPPLNTIKRFRFLDLSPQREFMLVPSPLRMDIYKGRFTGVFVEVLNPSDTETVGNSTSIEDVLNGIVAGLIASGLVDTAEVWGPLERSFRIVYDSSQNSIGSALANGAGNSPSISEEFDTIVGSERRTVYQIGEDIEAGNIFRVRLFGTNIDYEVGTGTSTIQQVDGTREGTVSESKYIF